ncbi:MAG: GrpB family protein [Candidatus Falkowbacteria bacterium]|nr:GrpB family protein [Candidatus Falkowbacteria bacterium]
MINQEQQAWLNHLNDSDHVKIIPYNPSVKEVFQIIKAELIKILGNIRISHRGSTALKISGQGEIDLYIPVSKKDFNITIKKLEKYLGKPGSVYEFVRARFVKYIENTKIEIFVINKNDEGWKASVRFEKYLKNNPRVLKEYERLKIKANGLSTRKYYAIKIAYINKVIEL